MQRKFTLGVLIGISLLSVVGCNKEPKTRPAYFKDSCGTCFEMTIKTDTTGQHFDVERNGEPEPKVILTKIPCEKVGL